MLRFVILPWLSLTASEILGPLDLSHYFDNNTIYAFGGTPFQFTQIYREPEGNGEYDWLASNEFETAEHGGTHMDAPYHFNENGWQIGEIPFERFFGKAVYLNLRDKAKKKAYYGVVVEEFELWETQNGPIPSGAIVLLDFGWTEKYRNVNEYLGTADILDTSSYHFPGLSMSGAEWLVRSGKVFGVGTDAVSIDVANVTAHPAHTILTANNLYILEHVAFPKEPLDPCGYSILALPMKICNGTGAPCRVLAMP